MFGLSLPVLFAALDSETAHASLSIWDLALSAFVFGGIGIVLLVIGVVVFEMLTRKLDVQDELRKGNIAVAITVGALMLSIAYIAAHVVR